MAGISTRAPTVGKPDLFSGTILSRWTSGILNQSTSDVAIVLLEITHPDIETPIRLNNSGQSVDSNGNIYIYFPFNIELPSDNETEPVARLSIANVDRQIGEAIDSISTPATVGMSIVSSVDPNTKLKDWSSYELRNTTRNGLEVSGDIMIRQYATEPFPNIRVRPSNFQNLHKA